MVKKVAILTNGGDVAGFNAVIRAIVKTAEHKGIEAYGFIEGYKGLLNNEYVKLSTFGNASGLIDKGGSIIGSSINANVFNYRCDNLDGTVEYKDLSDICVKNYLDDNFDCLFTLGGDSTQKSARDLSLKGIKVIGVPKTIDNDVQCTEVTFGYNTAVSVATDAIDRLHTTAATHHRVMVLETMGREAGWIALESAISGGADIALIPEIPYDIQKVADKINERKNNGKAFSIVVVSEGAYPKYGYTSTTSLDDDNENKGVITRKYGGVGEIVSKQIQKLTGLNSRCTVLGYMQRGGTPTAYDRVLSSKYGAKAMELAIQGRFNVLTVIKDGKLDSVPIEQVVGENKIIGAVQDGTLENSVKTVKMDDDLVTTALDLGICLGDDVENINLKGIEF